MKTPFSYYIAEKAAICEKNCRIDQKLYDEYGVKKGLRDKNGTGVLAGITNISHIQAYEDELDENGNRVPCEGKLLYRIVSVSDNAQSGIRCQHTFALRYCR